MITTTVLWVFQGHLRREGSQYCIHNGRTYSNLFILWKDPEAKHVANYQFSTRHVNRLAKGLKDNLTIPYEFVCITDDPTGIDTGLTRIVPIWNEFRDIGRCFVRLGLYAKEIRDIIGPRIANIDLDVAIVGNVDHIFGRKEPFVGYTDTKNPRAILERFT